MLFQKIVEKLSKTIFPQKGPKSISMDSGRLDKPFGPLIFKFFKYVWAIFWIDFWQILPISPVWGLPIWASWGPAGLI